MSVKSGLSIFIGIILVLSLTACGSGGSSSSKDPEDGLGGIDSTELGNNLGKVGILLKDSLSDVPGSPSANQSTVSDMSQLWVTVTKVSLIMEDEEWRPVFEGTHPYDLLTLQDDYATLLAVTSVPAGHYVKARVEIDPAEGQNCLFTGDDMASDPLNPCADGESQPLDVEVPSNKVDIIFDPALYIGPDTTEYIVFDLLPADSIHMTHTGNERHILRPVIHTYTMPAFMEEKGWIDMKVEELEGTVTGVSGCDAPSVTMLLSHKYGGGEISIVITNATISYEQTGEAATCGSLQIGDEVELKVSISSEGIVVAEAVEIEKE